MPHVVIIGAGFAGIAATETLAKKGFRVTLVDRHPYNTFQPLLYQVATGGLNPGDVTYSLRFFTARYPTASFQLGNVTGIDHDAKRVMCAEMADLSYDYLIIGNGVTVNHFGIPGAEEHSMSMYTRTDAIHVRDTVFGALETIASSPDPSKSGFTVLIVGGGATGVEMAGQLAELRGTAVPKVFPELDLDRVRVILVEMTEHLLMPFDEKLRTYTETELVKRGVELRLNTALSAVHRDRVDFEDGSALDVDLVIWAAGVTGDERVDDWDLPTGKGRRIQVDGDLRVVGRDDIFAVGDAGVIVDNPLPQLAQPAIQTGKHAAEQIIRLHEGRDTEVFSYTDKGTMATIGRGDAVLQLKAGLKLKGVVAWVGWIVLHIFFLLGGRNRVQTLINLAWRYVGPGRSGVILGDLSDAPRLKEITRAVRDKSERDSAAMDA